MTHEPELKVRLTQRALRDVHEIRDFSELGWGKRVADDYLRAIDSALEQLQSHPDLLWAAPDFHPSLRFYRVNKHLLVCDHRSDSIVVLTIAHASMDIAGQLSQLLPVLRTEVEILHQKLKQTDDAEL